MKKKTTKACALILAIVLSVCIAASCSSSEPEGEYDLDAQRTQFATMAESRQIEQAEGITTKTILQTEGDKLISVSYPQLDGNAGISVEIENYVNQKINGFADETTIMGAADTHTGLYSLVLTYKPYPVSNTLMGFKFTENSYSGMTDKQNNVETFVYDLSTSSTLTLSDVFDEGTDYLSAVSELSRSYLRRNETITNNMDDTLFQEGTNPEAKNYSRFVLTPDNQIIFFFEPGSIAPAQAGTPEVCIPLSELEPVLNQQNRELFYFPKQTEELPGEAAEQTEGEQSAQTELPMLNLGDEYLPPVSIEGIDPANDKVVALTFDDGPGPYTAELLDILKANDVPATFFLVGTRIADNASLVQRMYGEGHEIANHSWDHTYMTQVSIEEAKSNYAKCDDAVQVVIGKKPLLHRPPGGFMTEELAQDIGHAEIMWSVDTNDWKEENKQTDILYQKSVESGDLRDGGIILMHDIHPTSVQAADSIIKGLKDAGYKLVTVSQLIQIAEQRGAPTPYMFYNAHKPASAPAESTDTTEEGAADTPETEE